MAQMPVFKKVQKRFSWGLFGGLAALSKAATTFRLKPACSVFWGVFFHFVFVFPRFQAIFGGKFRGPFFTARLGRASRLQNSEGAGPPLCTPTPSKLQKEERPDAEKTEICRHALKRSIF